MIKIYCVTRIALKIVACMDDNKKPIDLAAPFLDAFLNQSKYTDCLNVSFVYEICIQINYNDGNFWSHKYQLEHMDAMLTLNCALTVSLHWQHHMNMNIQVCLKPLFVAYLPYNVWQIILVLLSNVWLSFRQVLLQFEIIHHWLNMLEIFNICFAFHQ